MLGLRKVAGVITGAAMLATSALGLGTAQAADDVIKVGVLHSLSGTMAISETTLKDAVLMMVDDLNKNGGLLGKKVEAVVVDPASNWPLFAEKARELIEVEKVDVVFGCWTSVSRKSVLPVFEELNGTDYVYPRTTNKILESFLKAKGVAEEDIMISYTPFGHSDWQTIVSDIKKFGSEGKKTAVVSTINGDANVPFYKELGNQGIDAADIPVVAFSVGEEELAGLDTAPLVGHLAAWNYFMSIESEENDAFIKKWKAFIGDDKRVTNDPMEATYIGFKMWAQAVQQAGTTDVDAVRQAMYGQKVKNLTGGTAVMNTNHHLSKPVLIGEIQDNGQIETVWRTEDVVVGDAWSDYIPESAKLIADWTYPYVCGGCEKPMY